MVGSPLHPSGGLTGPLSGTPALSNRLLIPMAALRTTAPVDGTSLYLGFQSTEVFIPKVGRAVFFHYVFESPHGDACYQLLVNGAVFPGYIWGAGTFWTPDGRYLAAQWTGPEVDRRGRTTVVIDLHLWKWIDAPGFIPESISNTGVRGKAHGGNQVSLTFERQTGWKAA